MVDSIASLPAMPSRSVPGTPGAPLTAGAASNASGLSGFSGLRRSAGPAPVAGAGGPVPAGIAGGQPLEGLTPAQRGFSNPDLAKAFNKGPGGFNPMTAPRVSTDVVFPGSQGSSCVYQQPYGQADPLYAGMDIGNGVAPLGGQNFAGGYDNYGFDDDNFGSGALYSGNGNMNMKSKRADMDRECTLLCLSISYKHVLTRSAS
jgi:hypothetical protein